MMFEKIKKTITDLKNSITTSSISIPKPDLDLLTDTQKYNVFSRMEKMEEKINANIENIKKTAQKAVDAAHLANLAKNSALEATNLSSTLFQTFTNMSRGMKEDVDAMIEKEKNLMTAIKNQVEMIGGNFSNFGNEIKSRTETIEMGSEELIKQLEDAAKEIKIPLDKVISEVKGIKIPSFLDIFAIGNSIGHAIRAFNHMTVAGYGGENSVLLETIEAFLQISAAFDKLKDGFTGFGSGVSNSANVLGNSIKQAMVEIRIGLSEFMASFERIFINMSYRMKVGEDTSQQIQDEKKKADALRQAEYDQWRVEIQ